MLRNVCSITARLAPLVLLAGAFLGGTGETALAVDFDYNQNEAPTLPAPKWVNIVDQGKSNPALAGLKTPAGIKVEVVSEEPLTINPVGMRFGDDGTPYVLEWRVSPDGVMVTYQVKFKDGTTAPVHRMQKSVHDELKTLSDADGEGRYDHSKTLMGDLDIPSSLLLHDGWVYLPSIGHVVRRRASKPGGPYDVQEEILKGLCGFHHHQVSGLTLSQDGWLYVTAGDDDNRGEGTDGTRATVLRTGAVFRCRPDGSELHEFARGFRNPYRDVAFDEVYNVFHVDNDQEDGSKFQGCRLMHVLEGADFGWRLAEGTVCCRTDFDRGAVFGEKPGKMPAMTKTGRGSPAGLLIYQGTAFPDFFRGLLIYPDVFRKMVRAYRVEQRGTTFDVVEQFELMKSDDGLFRPCQALVGPDGAIYIVDWRTDSGGAGRLWGDGVHGRIYRLTWAGNEAAPAIKPGPMDVWAKIPKQSDAELFALLESRDFELRQRAQRELVKRGEKSKAKFMALAADAAKPLPTRAVALGGACQLLDTDVVRLLVKLLDDKKPDMRRLAATALNHDVPAKLASDELLVTLIEHLDDADSAPRRAVALAVGSIDAQLPKGRHQAAAEALFAALAKADRHDVYLFDGIIRGLERSGAPAIALLVQQALGNKAEGRELAVSALEAMRTPAAVDGLNRIVRGTHHLTDAQLGRILETYKHILLEPAVDASAVSEWLVSHQQAPTALQVIALQTLAKVGSSSTSAQTLPLVLKLLERDDPSIRLAVIQAIGDNHLIGAVPRLVALARDSKLPLAERRAVVTALGRLRQVDLPWNGLSEKGVELVIDDLAKLADSDSGAPIREDLVRLVAAIDFGKARPLAEKLLHSEQPDEVNTAVSILGGDPGQAQKLGQMFVDGKLPRSTLPQVSAALQKHVEKDTSGKVKELLAQVLRGGLLVSLDPKEVARVDQLVRTTGDSLRGRGVFMSTERSQCLKCHKIEGIGGQVGPDLTKVWETHSVAKLLESMIDPSKEIKEGFQTFTATTKEGQVYSGLKISADAKQTVLRDQQGKDIVIPAADLDDFSVSNKSLMPDGVVAQLSYQEFIDLVAFLKDRKAQESLRGQLTEVAVVGPFAAELKGSEKLEQSLDGASPVAGADGKSLSWQRLRLSGAGEFNLQSVFPGDESAAYAVTYIYSPKKQTAKLGVWFDDEMRLTVNGKEVLSSTAVHSDQHVAAPLNPGWNRIVARVVNHKGEWAFRLSADGEQLRFSVEPK